MAVAPQIPQFPTSQNPNSPGPQSSADWQQFYLWLNSVKNSANDPPVFVGTAAAMPNISAMLNPGHLYFQTDTDLVYYSDGMNWIFLLTALPPLQGTWAQLPGGFGPNDAGILYWATDVGHFWRWTGAGWEWGPGDRHSGEIAFFTAAPGPGWHLADGSTQYVYQSDASRTMVLLPNLLNNYLEMTGAYTGAPVAAVAPTIEPAFTGISLAATTGNDNGTPKSAQPYASGTAVPVPAEPHNHNSPALTDPGHTHVALNDGTPATFALLAYFKL